MPGKKRKRNERKKKLAAVFGKHNCARKAVRKAEWKKLVGNTILNRGRGSRKRVKMQGGSQCLR